MKGLFNSNIINLTFHFFVFNSYVFACTCKNTNPKANPKRVITQQQRATLKISPIFIFLISVN